MSGWLKGIVGAALLLIAAFVSLVYGIYWQGASELPDELPLVQHRYPAELHAIYWVSLGGEGPMRVERLDPLKWCWEFYREISRATAPGRPVGAASLSTFAARSIASNPGNPTRNTNRLAAEIAATIRLSNEWTPEQIADYSLDQAWFGRGARGLQAAAPAYFGVSADQLTRAEAIALVGLMKFPSRDPVRDRERFNERYAYLAGKLGIDPAHIDPERDLARLKPAATAR
ncbi:MULTISPECIES: transglycosylase domain-containing protein [unclassified Lysobacter]|uniref:transglycosylase domain-containing protein n=1 Tax=unclassified Lysobacter TaxID=2635362 RepID=UPI0006FC8ABE|nr:MULTISPECIES: transglycosylase domain-containing protein [unclassified Lysobacter]KQZ59894.1 hypothetical protein ASD53_01570 [Lysobacter sp. Root559]KRC38344.1 hypothetical protein ASE10_01915 [Lysobacter sp. Root76]KRD71537.1 hypothetical protein ASE45_06960 [Lysobacter sp. Root96]